ncbi:hypothetical protein EDWATA_03107 [Edwardsiella tarda ATCC 23685]|uniref:Uncharacterized protein n=1 Tax=Edwardsiella tarda ATCC 23685 TaxID=500638 RepID=D4F8K7_EDWTA|nr:hypothetical protein EDWATA_03107 [Edwardsiella tarda ATCC 23685]
MASQRNFTYTARRHTDTIFVVFYFSWYANNHVTLTLSAGYRTIKNSRIIALFFTSIGTVG